MCRNLLTRPHKLYILSSILAWGVIELSLIDSSNPVWYPYYGCWFISLVAETCLLAIPADGEESGFKQTKVVIETIRVAFLCSLPISFWGFQRMDNKREVGDDDEESGLLSAGGEINGSANTMSYGAIDPYTNDPDEAAEAREARAKMMKKIEESGNWWVYAKSFAVSFVHTFPWFPGNRPGPELQKN